jgi:two-component system, OmpR family, KDP operon response regulator KdpE
LPAWSGARSCYIVFGVPTDSRPSPPLEELARPAGMVLTHQVLLDRVWGPEWIGDANYPKVVVRCLRQKLGDDAEHPNYIQTEWGVGYRFLSPR